MIGRVGISVVGMEVSDKVVVLLLFPVLVVSEDAEVFGVASVGGNFRLPIFPNDLLYQLILITNLIFPTFHFRLIFLNSTDPSLHLQSVRLRTVVAMESRRSFRI